MDPRTIIETYLTDLVSPALALSEARIQMSYNRVILSQPNLFLILYIPVMELLDFGQPT